MPELPDITVYIEALEERVVGKTIDKVRLRSPFLVRSFDPPLSAIEGRTVTGFRRMGKRIVFVLDEGLFLVVHLMVAGRFKYLKRGAKVPQRLGLCAFDFPDATLLLTEASKKKRASLHVLNSEETLAELDPGGVEILNCTLEQFRAGLLHENHTLKRTITDPHVFSGIGNAYSDEILHRAKLSPIKWTSRLSDDEIARLFECTQAVLVEWTDRLREKRKGEFPTKVTAFQPDMAVHGKHKKPCPVCGTKVQRIVRGGSEVNYCPTCQTDGKLLADRALSRLLRGDWPKTLEALEERKQTLRDGKIPERKKKRKKGGSDLQARIGALNVRPPAKPPSKKSLVTARSGTGVLFLFAHGAGAASTSDWMVGWARRLEALGKVVAFDYAYMREGRRRPDRREKLITTHIDKLKKARRKGPVVLIGKSMGGRMGCHVALEEHVNALVCLGYPLVSPGKSKTLRDQVLFDTHTPIMFVQGTRDKLCPLDALAKVRKVMTATNELYVVEAGDHSLNVTKTWLKQNVTSQDDVDERTLEAIDAFVKKHV
jgi:formamidopyrimidine-DNA glycosylase